jgi:predicted O-methyltransferase YrrM
MSLSSSASSGEFDPETLLAGKNFTSDWTSRNYKSWINLLAPLRDQPLSVLEIGSWEGRSALFFLNYLPRCKIVCVDTFKGSWENHAWSLKQRITQLWPIERRFDANLAPFAGRVEKCKEPSLLALGRFGLAQRRFDLVYIDGSHLAVDVYRDGVLAWPLVAPGGIVIFDDYIWPVGPEPDRPNVGIDAFLATVETHYVELARGHQVIIRKSED